MEKIFAEVGLGNETFLSTEIENGDKEFRIPRFIRPKIVNDYYLRLWFFKTAFILSTNSGLKITKKDKNKIKILFGIGGSN